MQMTSPQEAARGLREQVGSGGLDQVMKVMKAAKLSGDFLSPFIERIAKEYEGSGDSALQEAAQSRVDAARGEAWDKMAQSEGDVRRRRGAEYDKMGPEERGLARWDVESERVAGQRSAMGADMTDRAASMAAPGYPAMPSGAPPSSRADDEWDAESERIADQRSAMGATGRRGRAGPGLEAPGYPQMPDIQSLLDERAEWSTSDPASRGPIPPLPRDLPPEIQRMVDRDMAKWEDSAEETGDWRSTFADDPESSKEGYDAIWSPETRKALAQYDAERSVKWRADQAESDQRDSADEASNRRAYVRGDSAGEADARAPHAAAFDAMPAEAAKVEVADYGGTRAKMLGALKSGDLEAAQDAMRTWEHGGQKGVQAKNVWERIAGGHIARHRHDLQNILLKFPDAAEVEAKRLKRELGAQMHKEKMDPRAIALRRAELERKDKLGLSKVMDARAKGTQKDRDEAVKQKRAGVVARTGKNVAEAKVHDEALKDKATTSGLNIDLKQLDKERKEYEKQRRPEKEANDKADRKLDRAYKLLRNRRMRRKLKKDGSKAPPMTPAEKRAWAVVVKKKAALDKHKSNMVKAGKKYAAVLSPEWQSTAGSKSQRSGQKIKKGHTVADRRAAFRAAKANGKRFRREYDEALRAAHTLEGKKPEETGPRNRGKFESK
jgi:hypothetical protein